MSNNFRHIGNNFVPLNVVGKMTGKAMFAEDLRADGMVFARVYASLPASPSTSGATATLRRDSTMPRLCSRSRS